MTLRISSLLLARLVADARAGKDEICGLLFGDAGSIDRAEPCANVAADPARRFEIDPAALFAAHRAGRNGGPRVIGHYHSHPGGSTRPSPRDAAAAVPDGSIWLILANHRAEAWRAVAAGAVEGRFEPVSLLACAETPAPAKGLKMQQDMP